MNNEEISEEKAKVLEYLAIAQGHFIEESELSYKFMAQSPEQYMQVKGLMFLMSLNVGAPRPSPLLPSWQFARIYKEGKEVDEKEEAKF